MAFAYHINYHRALPWADGSLPFQGEKIEVLYIF